MTIPRHSDNVERMNAGGQGLHRAAVTLAKDGSPAAGAKLGHRTSEAKASAAQENGAQGGRPKGS